MIVLLGLIAAGPPAVLATFPGQNGRIAFASLRTGNFEIFSVHPDGSDPFNVTQNAGSDTSPDWSPDGTMIAFSSRRLGNRDIYVMQADGTGSAVRLTTFAGTDDLPSWSPDGTRIAFTRFAPGPSILIMNADGSGETSLVPDGAKPRWSPDGNKIVFASTMSGSPSIYTIHVDGTQLNKLTDDSLNASHGDWSPTGNRIVFVNNFCGTCDNSDVFVMKSNGKDIAQLTHDFGNNLDPSWAPDGTRIAFDHEVVGESFLDIWTMAADGSDLRVVTQDPAVDFGADWGSATT